MRNRGGGELQHWNMQDRIITASLSVRILSSSPGDTRGTSLSELIWNEFGISSRAGLWGFGQRNNWTQQHQLSN